MAASSAAWGWQSSESSATIPKSFGFEAATRYGASNQCYAEYDLFEPCLISCIRDAESILIFGPGEAKGELKKHLEIEGLGGRIVGVETVGEMTDGQIAAKARQHFLNLK